MNNSLRKFTAGVTALMVMATMTSVAAFADEPVPGASDTTLKTTETTPETVPETTPEAETAATTLTAATQTTQVQPLVDDYSQWEEIKTKLESGQSVEITGEVHANSAVVITGDVSITGNGTIILDTEIKNGPLFDIRTSANCTITGITINGNGNVKHGIQFWKTNSGSVSGVTILNTRYTGVQINGSSNVSVNNCTISPLVDSAYANVEYSMGKGVDTVPQGITVSGITANNDLPIIYADQATMDRVQENTGSLSGSAKNYQAIVDYINSQISGNAPEMELTTNPEGDPITVAPNPASGDSGDDSGNTSSSRDSGGSGESELTRQRREEVNRLWKSTRNALRDAAAGDVITAEADEADNVPTYVLLPLYGRDVTLVVNHDGESYTLTDDSIGTISANQVYFTFEAVAEFDAGEEAAE